MAVIVQTYGHCVICQNDYLSHRILPTILYRMYVISCSLKKSDAMQVLKVRRLALNDKGISPQDDVFNFTNAWLWLLKSKV